MGLASEVMAGTAMLCFSFRFHKHHVLVPMHSIFSKKHDVKLFGNVLFVKKTD